MPPWREGAAFWRAWGSLALRRWLSAERAKELRWSYADPAAEGNPTLAWTGHETEPIPMPLAYFVGTTEHGESFPKPTFSAPFLGFPWYLTPRFPVAPSLKRAGVQIYTNLDPIYTNFLIPPPSQNGLI